MNRPGKTGLAALAAALAIGAGGGAAAGYSLAEGGNASAASTANASTTAATAQPAANATKLLSINQVYEQAGASVVEITVSTSDGSSGAYPFGGGGGSSSATAQGSGFVYDDAGHIVTNAHVVEGATSMKVQLANGKTYNATLVGSDESTDLAVLKIAIGSRDAELLREQFPDLLDDSVLRELLRA